MASKAKRALIGCGLGCGTLVLLVIVLIVAFTLWLARPGELLQPRQLLGHDTTGYLEWTLRLEDPETDGFVRALIETVQELPSEVEALPGWLGNWIRGLQRREAEEDIERLFPMVAAWTVRPGATPTEDLHLLTVSIEPMGNRLVFGDWLLGFVLRRIPEAGVHTHRREKIYQLPLNKKDLKVTFFLRGVDVFFTSDLETARLAVDRLDAAVATVPSATELQHLFDANDAGTLRGALVNARGELGRLWQKLPATDEPDFTRVRAVALNGGLEADGSLAGRLEFLGPDRAWAEDHAAALGEAIRQAMALIDLEPDLTVVPTDHRVRVEFSLPDLAGRISHLMHEGWQLEGEGKRIRIDL